MPNRYKEYRKIMPAVRRLVMVPHVQYSLIPGLTCTVEYAPAHPLPHMHLTRQQLAQQGEAWGQRRSTGAPKPPSHASRHSVTSAVFSAPPLPRRAEGDGPSVQTVVHAEKHIE